MINEIIAGMGCSIHEEFGDNYCIYADTIPQGMREPCFLIRCLAHSQNVFLGDRYQHSLSFCITYVPKERLGHLEENDVTERLYKALETIEVTWNTKKLRGKELHAEPSEECLSFFVDYKFYTTKSLDTEYMESIEIARTEIAED